MSSSPAPSEPLEPLDTGIEPSAARDRSGHGKMPPRPDDDELARRAERDERAAHGEPYPEQPRPAAE